MKIHRLHSMVIDTFIDYLNDNRNNVIELVASFRDKSGNIYWVISQQEDLVTTLGLVDILKDQIKETICQV